VLEALSELMVAEGHRVSNHDLSEFVGSLLETPKNRPTSGSPRRATSTPQGVIALALQAFEPPRTLAAPNYPIAKLMGEWTGLIREANGEIWEHDNGCMLVCWTVGDLDNNLNGAVAVGQKLRRLTQERGYQLSAGLAPGVAQIRSDTKRPPEGWELAGPFYLARWMMNLSAHRGRMLMTEVSARKTANVKTHLLGQISILGNRFINLYEVGS
jgi:hypothetical protein